MAEVLLDSCIFGRYLNPDDSHYAITRSALRALVEQNHTLCFVPQVAFELLCFMTKKRQGSGTDVNGFGWSVLEASRRLEQIESQFTLRLPDPRTEYGTLRSLVRELNVSGTRIHDVRLVAAAMTLGIRLFLTLDESHFRRASEAGHIELLTPASVHERRGP
jgi:predicted nucleic acid-binding protein